MKKRKQPRLREGELLYRMSFNRKPSLTRAPPTEGRRAQRTRYPHLLQRNRVRSQTGARVESSKKRELQKDENCGCCNRLGRSACGNWAGASLKSSTKDTLAIEGKEASEVDDKESDQAVDAAAVVVDFGAKRVRKERHSKSDL